MDTLENEIHPESEAHTPATSPLTEGTSPTSPAAASEQPTQQEQPRYASPAWQDPAGTCPPQQPAGGYYHYVYPQQTSPRPVQPVRPAPPQQGGYYASQYQQPGNGQSWNGYAPPVPPTAPPVQPRPVPPRPAPRKRKGSFWRGFVATLLVICLVVGGCFATGYYVNAHWQSRTETMTNDFNSQLAKMQQQLDSISSGSGLSISGSTGTYAPTGDAMTPAQVYNQNVQSVVAISSTISTYVFGQSTTGTSTGSGFIVTSDGYVVTNYHVVDGASAITVTTNSGTTYDASLVGGDENNDVAVLKVEASGLPYVTIGSSDTLIVGDQVAAIGNPLGTLTNTLTVGYISAKDRAVTTDNFAVNMLQTDAAINSGNSGGPLFNMYGQVVGITSAKYSGESSSGATIEGIGFAIPIDDVIDLIEDLINDGFISSGYLGVSVSDYYPSYASVYGLPENTPSGAVVREVVDGYSAARAGVELNDVIVALGEYSITGVTSLTSALRHYDVGETTTIILYRNGERLMLSITLDEKPDETPTTDDSASQPVTPNQRRP